MPATAAHDRSRLRLALGSHSSRPEQRLPRAEEGIGSVTGDEASRPGVADAARSPALPIVRRRRAEGAEPRAASQSTNALTLAEREFHRLLMGSRPLALDGEAIGHGLPRRPVNLGELRDRLMTPDALDEFKDDVWRELVRLTRGFAAGAADEGRGLWVIGCIGVAMPGLRGIAGRATRSSPAAMAEDIVSALVAEFVAQLGRIDLTRPHILERLLLWARKAAVRARARTDREVPHDPATVAEFADTAIDLAPSQVEPAALLDEAARQGVITSEAATLIKVTRLDGVRMREYARELGEAETKLYSRRTRAEERLADAIRDGQVSALSVGWGA